MSSQPYTQTSFSDSVIESLQSVFNALDSRTSSTATSSLSPGELSSMSAMQSSLLSAITQSGKSSISSGHVNSITSLSKGPATTNTTTSSSTGSAVRNSSTFTAAVTSQGLAPASIAGISIGAVAGCCTLLLVAFFTLRHHRQKPRSGDKLAPAVNLFAGKAELEAKGLPYSLERELATNANRHELEA